MLLDSLPHLVTINHVTYSQDASGSDVEAESAPYVVDEPAWVQPLSNREIDFYKQRNQDVSHKIYLQRDPGLKLSDRLIAKDGDDVACPYNGRSFCFRCFAETTAGLGLLWKAMVYIDQEEA